jgi:catechol 2,3-dioxygenase-like lactoylglutathione lyase family enzyme
MIDYQNLFHVGVRVPDLAAAATELGEGLGVTWAEVRESEAQQLWTPKHGAQEHRLKYTYSTEGPQHIELLEGAAGSLWDGNDRPGAHHVGIWVDDVGGETERLVESGWTLVGAHRSPADRYGIFSYLQPPGALIVELVDRAVLPHFETWWGAAAT